MRGENKRKMNKNNIYFSIIMPTYNRAFCIEKAINSLLKQTYQNYELIIIDDGSTDNTEDLIRDKYSDLLKNKKKGSQYLLDVVSEKKYNSLIRILEDIINKREVLW